MAENSPMSYQILAQKYRPQDFDGIVGQEAVTRTLKNSVISGRTANAYLFCGPRGVGKTSVARILSKTLNCESEKDKKPCNKCLSCKEITSGNSIDVLEIDGASNNSVDEIRTLRENVKFSPSKGKFKIYIIDEVHMLSQGAFNALLKTLEEPPAHVKFIFATTEAHKVPATIISRCQRFDFKRIPASLIAGRIKDISRKEKIDIDEKAVVLISRTGDGSLRDSLVMLDQMIAYAGGKIVFDDIVELLGVIRSERIFDISAAMIAGDVKSVIEQLDILIDSGKDPVFIANCLVSHYRDVMVLKSVSGPTRDMAFSDEEINKLKELAESVSIEEILYIFQNISSCLNLMKSVVFSRALLEVTLVKIAKRGSMMSIDDIVNKLGNLSVRNPGYGNVPRGADTNKEVSPRERSDGPVGADDEVLTGPDDDNGQTVEGSESLKYSWRAILNEVKERKMSVFTFLNPAKPISLSDNEVVIGFGKDHAFHKEVLETSDNKSIIEDAAEKILGGRVKIKMTLLEFLGDPGSHDAGSPATSAEVREKMKPYVEKAMDIFGGHVIREITEDNR